MAEGLRLYEARPVGWGPATDAWHDQLNAWLDDHPQVDWVELLRLAVERVPCKCGWPFCRSCRERQLGPDPEDFADGVWVGGRTTPPATEWWRRMDAWCKELGYGLLEFRRVEVDDD